MRHVLFSLIAAFCMSSAMAVAPARVLTLQDMVQPPLAATAYTQCNLLIAAYFTLQDGTLAKIDVKHHEGIDYNKALAWGDTALHGAERVEAACDDPAKMIHTADVKPHKPLSYEPLNSDPTMPAVGPVTAGIDTVVRISVCGEVLGLMIIGKDGVKLLKLKDMPADYRENVLSSLKMVKEAGGDVEDTSLDDKCVKA